MAQYTKQGLLFIFNRVTGEPIHGNTLRSWRAVGYRLPERSTKIIGGRLHVYALPQSAAGR